MIDSEKVYDEFMDLIGRLSNNEIKMLIDNFLTNIACVFYFTENETQHTFHSKFRGGIYNGLLTGIQTETCFRR